MSAEKLTNIQLKSKKMQIRNRDPCAPYPTLPSRFLDLFIKNVEKHHKKPEIGKCLNILSQYIVPCYSRLANVTISKCLIIYVVA